jgi:1,4-dihydroxy-2-naphthoate octaprenyltransferase
MTTLKTWISAFRLRTLPLASSAVLMGANLSDLHHSLDTSVSLLCFITAVALQILSNLANDYGDYMKGTDNDKRLGNTRALQSGNITPKQMLSMIIVFVALSLVSGIALLYKASEGEINYTVVSFFIIGLVAIAAAIKYTVGKHAYGYSGLGDLAVFIFFGPVAVCGTFLLSSHFRFMTPDDYLTLLPAAGIGLLCTAVLNTNNIRDVENDRTSGKYTIPVKIGLEKARAYHTCLLVFALILLFAYSLMVQFHWIKLLQIPAAWLIVKNLLDVRKTEPSPAFNNFLKQLSLGTLLFVFVYVITNAAAKIWNAVDAILILAK